MTYKTQMVKHFDGFGARLKNTREGRGFSQAQLAKLTGLPPASISNFEANRRMPSFDSLRKICFALHVKSDFLAGMVDENPPLDIKWKWNSLNTAQRIHLESYIDYLLERSEP